MSTEAAVKDQSGKQVAPVEYGLLVDLDGVGLAGKKAEYQAASRALGSGKLNQPAFMKHCMLASPEQYAEKLIEATGSSVSAAKLIEQVRTTVAEQLSAAGSLQEGLSKFIHAATGKTSAIGVMTALPEELANSMLARFGLAQANVKLLAVKDPEKGFPRADLWLKLARQLGKSPRACVAVTANQLGCKTALSAGMRCIALPGEYSGHEDFSGADLVLDSWDDMSAKDIFEATMPPRH